MTKTAKHTYYPGKNPIVSLVSFLLLVVLIGLMLIFGTNSDDHSANPTETVYHAELLLILDC